MEKQQFSKEKQDRDDPEDALNNDSLIQCNEALTIDFWPPSIKKDPESVIHTTCRLNSFDATIPLVTAYLQAQESHHLPSALDVFLEPWQNPMTNKGKVKFTSSYGRFSPQKVC